VLATTSVGWYDHCGRLAGGASGAGLRTSDLTNSAGGARRAQYRIEVPWGALQRIVELCRCMGQLTLEINRQVVARHVVSRSVCFAGCPLLSIDR
jgi:hypothetical protein